MSQVATVLSEHIDDFVRVSLRQFFNDLCATEVTEVAPEDAEVKTEPGIIILKQISFSGDGSSGHLLLACDESFACETIPVEMLAGTSEQAFVEDWVGEIANQVLARIVNRFSPLGVTLDMETPIYPSLHEVLSSCVWKQKHLFKLKIANHSLSLLYVIKSTSGLTAVPSADNKGSMKEGDKLFFSDFLSELNK